jgi:hypothetical protein
MKNIHLLQTDNKWSRLYFNVNDKEFQICEIEKTSTILKPNRQIYITSDEEIKEGDWCLNIPKNIIYKKDGLPMDIMWKKIILTTDQDLIKDGVQSIDDEFLKWFVKNPSCEEVDFEVVDDNIQWYKIIIPKKNFYCGDEVDYDDKCLEQCDGCVDATGVDYGYLPEEKPKYPIGGYAPGNYMCNCSTCKTQFQGDKRAVQCEPCAIKMIQKQHLIDIMKQDEELGMYDETFDEYLQRLKDRRTEDDYKYTDEDFKNYIYYIFDCYEKDLSVYKCLEFMYFAEREIQPEQIWNEEKKKGLKEVIEEYNEQLTYSEAARKEERINDSSFFERQAKKELRYSEEDIENIIAETWIRCVGNDGNNFKEAKDKIIEQFKK